MNEGLFERFPGDWRTAIARHFSKKTIMFRLNGAQTKT